MINGVPVVTAPAEIDVTNSEQLRVVLLRSAAQDHTTIVVDMTGTRYCDSAGLTVLVRAHRRALADGGELRLVVPADGAVSWPGRCGPPAEVSTDLMITASLRRALASPLTKMNS